MPSGDTPDLNLLFPQRAGAPEQKLFGRYTLKRVLGRGGMGIVWMAHDDELHRHVAMKFLPDMLIRDREAVNDLKRETRRSLDLTHHHIVRIYDFTQDDNCAAIIMEYVDGETLSAMKTQQAGGCFSVSTITAWAAHFCEALDYAHRQARVVHRDLKPANLMVNSRGDLKVTDFGISRSMSDSMTRVSMSNTAGTLAYMSPEQALGAPPAAGDDVYAFGATIYDLLTGRPPFFRGNVQVQLETVIPPKMGDRREDLGNQGEPIPDLWEEVIAKCLAKRPHDRPQSMGEIATMLGLGAPSSSLRTTFSPGAAPGTAAGVPGTTSTHARTATTDDAVTRTDAIPMAPQTTRPGAPVTRSTNYLSTPRPTALRDVIPGYVDEPVAKPTTPATARTTSPTSPTAPTAPTAPTTTPPPTTSTQAKLEQFTPPTPPPPPATPEPDPGATLVEPELIVDELPAQVEPAPVSVPAVFPSEPEVTNKSEPAIEVPIPPSLEEPPIAEAEIEPLAAPIEPAVEIVEEAAIEPVPIVEPEQPTPSEEAVRVESEAAPDQAEFPTLYGELSVEPEVSPVEVEPAAEPEPPEIEEAPVPEPEVEVTIKDEPAPAAEFPMDEAAVTQFAAPVSVPIPEPVVENSPAPQAEPSRPERSSRAAFEAPVSSPARRKAKPWLPIAAVVGVVAMASLWTIVPKGGDKGKFSTVRGTPAVTAPPTPVPIVDQIQEKLERARTLVTNEEYDEATALLKAVQGIDPANAEASALLSRIDDAKRIKAERAMAEKAMAEREQKVSEYLQQAKLAKDRRDWQAMRTAVREARKLDFQNALMRSDLDSLDADATEGERQVAEMERQKKAEEAAEARRQKELADMKDEEAAKQRAEREAAADAERKRIADQEKRKKSVTTRPQRKTEPDESDRPPRRPTVVREDTRPPASEKPVVKPRPATQAPPETKPQQRPVNVNRGTSIGG